MAVITSDFDLVTFAVLDSSAAV